MFSAILGTQWKWTRFAALVGLVLGFGIPVLSLLSVRDPFPGSGPMNLIRNMQQYGAVYGFLAGGVGLAFAMLAWSHDHRGRHVYAMSLPISRARYTAMRFAAGSIFLIAPAAGVLAGALIGIATTTLPEGLHAYPVGLTIRFLLASFVAYALFFAISSSSTRASGVILIGITAIIAGVFMLGLLGVGEGVLDVVATALFGDYGVLSVFTGRWMLVDV